MDAELNEYLACLTASIRKSKHEDEYLTLLRIENFRMLMLSTATHTHSQIHGVLRGMDIGLATHAQHNVDILE